MTLGGPKGSAITGCIHAEHEILSGHFSLGKEWIGRWKRRNQGVRTWGHLTEKSVMVDGLEGGILGK